VVSNSLNPVWEGTPGSGGEALHLGVHEAGAAITVGWKPRLKAPLLSLALSLPLAQSEPSCVRVFLFSLAL
jgi:hypothetical protein